MLKRIVLSALLVFAATVCLTGMLGALVQGEILSLKIAAGWIGILSALVLFVVCYISAKTSPQGRMQVAVGTAVFYVIVMAVLRWLLHPDGTWHVNWQMGLVLAASEFAGFLSGMKKQRYR